MRLIQRFSNMKILDLESLVMEHGIEKMYDPRFHYIAKTEFGNVGNNIIAQQFAKAISVITGKRKKCLILDLDNTLWGGILGEDGKDHIILSNDGIGKAFYDFQNQILKLYDSGIILAICSKNDIKMALDTIQNHPHMLIREDKLAAVRINWLDKATNIRSIAKELNIGLDSCVFLDDSKHERTLVSATCPEVCIPDLPDDPAYFSSFLANLEYFETMAITSEDKKRGQMYAQERRRGELKKNTTLQDFFDSLHIQVNIEKASESTIPRIAQLTQKTNQFNLSTCRYTETEIKQITEDPTYDVLIASTKDRLGDSGIVGVAIIKHEKKICLLNTFLISCRVLVRGIEAAFLGMILKILSKKDITCLKIQFVPSGKNDLVKDFFMANNIINNKNIYNIKTNINIIPNWITVKLHE